MQGRKVAGKGKIVLAYEWAGADVPIGETRDPDLLVQVGERILQDAEARLELVKGLDPLLAIEAHCELVRKRRSLTLVLPCNPNRRRVVEKGATATCQQDTMAT
jgi:hypothetical protein